jgi:hypothetical protein
MQKDKIKKRQDIYVYYVLLNVHYIVLIYFELFIFFSNRLQTTGLKP